MSFGSLLNKRCSWYRRINVGDNEYQEVIYSDALIASDVPCSRQVGHGNNMRQSIEDKKPAEFNYKLVKYFLDIDADIQEGDRIVFEGSDHRIVRDVRDAAGRGHHLEVLAEEVQEIGEQDQSRG